MIASLLSRAARDFRNATLENPAVSLQDPRAWNELFGGVESDAGIQVTHRSALQLASVWQAVSMISNDFAMLTPHVYRMLDTYDKAIDTGHPAEYLISGQPNDEMCAFEFWKRALAHVLLWQNAYIYTNPIGRFGPAQELISLLPDRTKPMRNGELMSIPQLKPNELFYVTEVDGRLEPLFKEQIIHVKGLSLENTRGVDFIYGARNCIGLGLAAEGFVSKFFANGSQMGGIIMLPPGMSDKAMNQIEQGFIRRTSTKDNWFKTAILRDGAKFESTTVKMQESETAQLRQDQVRDMGRFFNLPPFKLGLQDSVAYNSAEMSQLVYLISTLSPWMHAVKGATAMRLLTDQERRAGTHRICYDTSALIEVDAKTLNEVLAIQRQNLVINGNEWRHRLGMNKMADPIGDKYFNPNTKAGGGPDEPSGSGPAKPAEGGKTKAPARSANRVEVKLDALLRDCINRAARRVCFDARKSAASGGKFAAWIDGQAAEHREVVDGMLRPSIEAVAAILETDASEDCPKMVDAFFAGLLSAVSPFIEPPHAAGKLEENVGAACAIFEQSIADKLIPTVLNRGELVPCLSV